MAGLIALGALPSMALGQPFNVRAWYAAGQVFVIWEFPAPPAVQTDTVEIYASSAPQLSTLNMTLMGRLFYPEYTGSRLKLMSPSARIRVPMSGGGTYQLAADEGVFVHTPHQAGNLFFAVVDTGSTNVGALNSAATAFGYDPVNNPVRAHEQFSGFTPGGNPSAAYIVWADGRADYADSRPDIPVLANLAKHGVPHVFAVTRPVNALPPDPLSCVFVMHGGNDLYTLFRPGQPERSNMSLSLNDGIVVSPDDAIYYNNQNTLVLDNTDWFGFVSDFDPFSSAPRSDPLSTAVVVNYTQRRVLWILDWLLSSNSPYTIDPARVAMIGHSMGSRGTSHLTRMRPERFCAAVCHCPPNNLTIPPLPGQVNPLRGNWSQNLATNLSLPGVGVLGIADVVTPTTRLSPTERDLPITRFYSGTRDEQGAAAWSPAQRAVLDSLNDSRMGHMLLWDEREHAIEQWGIDSNDATDDPSHCDPWPDRAEWIAPVRTERESAQYLVDTYRSDQSFPGFFNVDEDPLTPGRQPDPGPGDPCAASFDVWGTWGGYCDWDGATIVDDTELWECTIFLRGLSAVTIDNALVTSLSADASLRRTQQFNPPPGAGVTWWLLDEATDQILQSGSVAADVEGVVVVPGLTVRRDPDRSRLIVSTNCIVDLNRDGLTDAADFVLFQDCLVGAAPGGSECAWADRNGDGVTNGADIQAFVQCLLAL